MYVHIHAVVHVHVYLQDTYKSCMWFVAIVVHVLIAVVL